MVSCLKTCAMSYLLTSGTTHALKVPQKGHLVQIQKNTGYFKKDHPTQVPRLSTPLELIPMDLTTGMGQAEVFSPLVLLSISFVYAFPGTSKWNIPLQIGVGFYEVYLSIASFLCYVLGKNPDEKPRVLMTFNWEEESDKDIFENQDKNLHLTENTYLNKNIEIYSYINVDIDVDENRAKNLDYYIVQTAAVLAGITTYEFLRCGMHFFLVHTFYPFDR